MCPFVSSFPSPLALLRSRLRSKWRRTGTSQSRESLACSRLSHSVRTFSISISRTRQSRSLEQAFRGSAESRKWLVTIMENRHLFGLHALLPLQVTWCSLGSFINCTYIWKKQFYGVTSRGMKWVNKPYKLKRPLERLRVRNWSWTLLGLLKYSQTSLIRTPKGQNQVSALHRCPYFWGRERYISFLALRGTNELSV